MLQYHIIGFGAGFILDLILGDPYWLPHPVRLIGRLITAIEHCLLKGKNGVPLTDQQKLQRGRLLVIGVLAVTGLIFFLVLYAVFSWSPYVGVTVESLMTYQALAVKCLGIESRKVYEKLRTNDLEGAREAVSRIVGRDVQVLDEAGVAKATVETVAENCSDGVIAPMLYLAIGGPVLGFLYKAVNTMDSMVGYKNDRYRYFGRSAAKLDDAVNYLPARIGAGFMILAACLSGKEFHGRKAFQIYKRDRRKHASPNSAHTESVCAGALGIQLAGDAVYFGKTVKKPYIGDADRPVEYQDIIRANRLLYRTAFLCEGICLLVLCLL